MINVPKRYVPKQLSKKDKKKQANELKKSRKAYKRGKYHTRKKMKSFKSKVSPHIIKARKMYKVDKITPNKKLAKACGCKIEGLRKIVKKGQGAYFSSGSRPNQTGHSWGYARMASSITGGKASAVDYNILEKYCTKKSKALKLAKKMRGKGTRRVKKVKIGGGKWTRKYKRSIDCKNPKGFSQKQHCNFGRVTRKARAIFKKKNNVTGKVLFEQVKKGVKVTYDFKGLKNGKHGFHVHEKGNFKGDCNKAGAHYNPQGHNHAGRKSKKRHVGDLGNVTTKNRVTRGSFIDKKISLKGKNNIIGRSLIIHDLKDDLGKGKDKESLITGNAGGRLNCTKILKYK
tara:strand:- start:3086 stop:4114 length:1029 start_codon:yes stop_codon:yes gene_type:complete